MKRKLALGALIVGIIIAARLSGLDEYLSFDAFAAQKDALKSLVDENLVRSITVYMVIYIAVITLALPGAAVMTIAGGFLFGVFAGTAAANVGASIGAVASFLIARYLVGSWVQERYAERLAAFNREIEENGYLYLLTLRFIPLFPFFLINLFAGLTKVSLWTFTWTTVVGILPGGFVYAFAGSRLGEIDRPGEIFSGDVLLAFVLLGVFSAVPVIVQKISRATRRKSPNGPASPSS